MLGVQIYILAWQAETPREFLCNAISQRLNDGIVGNVGNLRDGVLYEWLGIYKWINSGCITWKNPEDNFNLS